MVFASFFSYLGHLVREQNKLLVRFSYLECRPSDDKFNWEKRSRPGNEQKYLYYPFPDPFHDDHYPQLFDYPFEIAGDD